MPEGSPTARALLVLELISNSPGITADRLAQRLGVSDRAARRYVGILREAGIPIDSTPGRYGGYRTGRGLRLPPLMFTGTEALALAMAVLEGHGAADDTDPVGSALAKIIRVLPEAVATPVEAVRRVSVRSTGNDGGTPDLQITAELVLSCAEARRLRLSYRLHPGADVSMDVDPWAVVVRYNRWYLLCWSHAKQAQRALRVDRVTAVDRLAETFTPPAGLDAARALEENMAEGWRYAVDVTIDASAAEVAPWIARTLGRLEPIDDDHCRLVASTDDPDWYAAQLANLRAPFHILGSRELLGAASNLGHRLMHAAAPPA